MRHLLLPGLLFAAPALAGFNRLHAARATSSSFLESNWNKYQENYHPSYALDDDPATAWVEGADGDGVGESLTVPLSPLKSARTLKLVVTPGYQKSKALFAANGTPTVLGVVVRDLGGKQTAAMDLTVKPVWGTQTFEVPVRGGLATVMLTLKAVKAGTKYRDTCLSDVQFFVDSDTPYDARVEQARRTELAKWKAERLATAKYFASLPKTYPFAAPRYRPETLVEPRLVQRRWKRVTWLESGEAKTEPNPAFQEIAELVAAKALPAPMDEEDATLLGTLQRASMEPGGRWFAATTKPPVVAPDGLAFPAFALPFLSAAEVTLFESKATSAAIARPKVEEGMTAERRSDVRLLEGTAAAPKRIAFRHVRQVSDRVEYQESTWVLLRFGDDGQLDRIASLMHVLDADGKGEPSTITAQVWRLTPKGPIESRELSSWNGANSEYGGPSEEDGLSLSVTRFVPVTK